MTKMEICSKKSDGRYYICVEDNRKHFTLITPSGQIKDLVRTAFDEPFDIDTSSESNLRLEISQFKLKIIQVASYCDHLRGVFRSMVEFGESEPSASDKKNESGEIESSPEELIVIYEKVIPMVKKMLHRKIVSF